MGSEMAARVVTMVLLVFPVLKTMLLVLAAARTLNSRRQELLLQDCGRRLVESHRVGIPRIVGDGDTTAYHGEFPWQARIVISKRAS